MDGQMPMGAMPPKQEHHGMPGWIAIIVILALLAGGYWFWQQSGGAGGSTEEIAPGQTLTKAPRGRVIAGFPQEFLLEDGVAIAESASINYADSGTDLFSVSYLSKKSFEENIAAFRSYLEQNGWDITQMANPENEPVTNFYAYKGQAEVNITLALTDEGVAMTIAYVVHGQQQ